MYKCEECGHLFEEGEQAKWTEMHGLTYGNGEEWQGCPLCYGVYEIARPCKLCGDYGNTEEDYCEDCKNDIKKRFSDFVEKEFTEEERELLNELYDGEWI